MVNANGQRTRMRDSTDTLQTIELNSTHRLFSSECRVEREHWIAKLKVTMEQESPATRRMMRAVLSAMAIGFDAAHGYRLAAYVNRAAIAEKLGRTALVPYDIQILRKLASKKLIVESKRALPRKQYGEIWLGSGAEFVYSIPSNVLFAMLANNPNERTRFAAMMSQQTAREQQATSSASQAKRQAHYDVWEEYQHANKRSLFKRIGDWLGW